MLKIFEARNYFYVDQKNMTLHAKEETPFVVGYFADFLIKDCFC